MTGIEVSEEVECEHITNVHPSAWVEVDVATKFENVDSIKELKVGDRGVCTARGCSHNCVNVEVTAITLPWVLSIKPDSPMKNNSICNSPVVI